MTTPSFAKRPKIFEPNKVCSYLQNFYWRAIITVFELPAPDFGTLLHFLACLTEL